MTEHVHEWKLEATSVAPALHPVSIQRLLMASQTVEQIRFSNEMVCGVTTRLYRCSTCGALEKVEMLGKESA